MINKIIYRLRAALVSQLFYNTNTDIHNSLLICGSARSGTTWLAELINRQNDYRLIFEPFLGEKVEEWKSFPDRLYAGAETIDPNLKNVLHHILSGKIRNSWTDSLNLKIVCDQRIIKAVRANLLLPYIIENFPSLKILFVHRQPIDVIRSRISLGWIAHLEDILKQKNYIDRYFPGQQEFLLSLTHTVEQQAAFWALENLYVLKHFENQKNLLIVQYERLSNKDQSELENISRFIGTELYYGQDKPSQSARAVKKVNFSEEEIQKINKVIDRLRNSLN